MKIVVLNYMVWTVLQKKREEKKEK
jgi:hypothetical protein